MTKAHETLGVLFGLILFFVWLFLLNKVEFFFFSEKEVLYGAEVIGVKIPGQYLQVIIWLTAGLLPFFLIVGHYLLYGNTAGGTDKIRDIIAMKGTFLGFLIWLVIVVLISLLKINIPFWTSIGGGYLTIILIVFLLRERFIRVGEF